MPFSEHEKVIMMRIVIDTDEKTDTEGITENKTKEVDAGSAQNESVSNIPENDSETESEETIINAGEPSMEFIE